METKISRSELYECHDGHDSSNFVPMQHLDFEIIENEIPEVEEAGEEFEFPLFSTASVQTVNLKRPMEEHIIQTRPRSFYFAEYSPLERAQLKQVAISGEDVIAHSGATSVSSGLVINLDEHNKKQITANKKSRPGKKRRENRILSKNRAAETAKLISKLAAEKRRIMKKKRRGGVKNRKR